ncbi:MAG: EutN/CcmL family microcompartment protein [Polyangia bacterium]|jgi:ethanolamine utilization protein EutN|nr:EutN/CcmL family microcompartment protein [Polyangia bacterium]
MVLGRVLGNVVCTVKDPGLKGIKLMVVQILSESGAPRGAPEVAADAGVHAGPGDLVFLATKKEAAMPFGDLVPVDLAITGFVDSVTLQREDGK